MSTSKITLLDGSVADRQDLLLRMSDDEFYYGFMGEHAMSSSSIKRVLDGTYFQEGECYSAKTKDAFRTGTLYHMAVLEYEKLAEVAKVAPCETRRAKVYKELFEENGEHTYTAREWNRVMGVRERLKEEVPMLFDEHGSNEVPAVGVIDSIPYRGKADRIDTSIATEPMVVDLKTTSNIWAAHESISNFGYDIQLFIYCHLFDVEPEDFWWLFVSKRNGDWRWVQGNRTWFQSGGDKVELAHKIYRKHNLTLSKSQK